jgi:hypothetical protein
MKPKVLHRNILIEATIALTVARLAVATLSTERLLRWASRPPRQIKRFNAPMMAAMVSWSVDRVGAKPWMKAACLPRALAAQLMLRRRGMASRLCLGVARAGGNLAAHAWLELAQAAVIGGGEVPRFTRLVEFGDGGATVRPKTG